ncbi:hypothetical protein [Curtobacterium sp. VKM Ac-2852]|nr:hypothetical protein [Curtobacterium sp. VKM Ac-2852]
MPQPADDDEIQRMLDAADDNPDDFTPDQIVNLARGRDKNA